jgi:prepilin-type N-terminal cleavage/methylation domain-containing protein
MPILQVSQDHGFTLVELLVSTVISAVVILAATSMYMLGTRSYHDIRIKSEADETAQMVLDMISKDIQLAGNGLPNASDWTGPATESAMPIIATESNASQIVMRSSKTGTSTVLTTEATPKEIGFSLEVQDSIFNPGDRLYLSGLSVGQEIGLSGYVVSTAGNVIEISGNEGADVAPYFSDGAVFPAGTLAYKIPYIAYTSNPDWSGIRQWEGGILDTAFSDSVIMAPNTTFSLEYLNSSLGTVALSDANIINSLALIRITVYARGLKPLSKGTTYQTWAQKTVSIKFLTVNRAQAWN